MRGVKWRYSNVLVAVLEYWRIVVGERLQLTQQILKFIYTAFHPPPPPAKQLFNPLKPSGNYIPHALTIGNSAFCIYGFCVILTANSDYFLKHR
jgi:hypothetical protein